MSAIVIRYMQIFCVAVLFDNASCDQHTLMAASRDHDQLLTDSGCAVRCMDADGKKTLEMCYDECASASKLYSESTSAWPAADQPTFLPANSTFVTQVCRDNASMVLEVVFDETTDYDESDAESNGTQLFIFRLHEEASIIVNNHIVVISTEPSVRVTDLNADSKYNVFVTLLNANLEYSVMLNDGVEMATQPNNMQPSVVRHIRFGPFLQNLDNARNLDVEVIWEPETDNTCYYDVVKHSANEVDRKMFPDVIEIRNPDHLHHVWLTDLPLGAAYTLSVHGINTHNPDLRSNDSQGVILNVPTCLEFYKENMTMCKPYKPTGLEVHVTLIAVHTYYVNVSWDQPPTNPTNYTVILLDSRGSNYSFTVNGNETKLVVREPLKLFDNPLLKVVATSAYGEIKSTLPINMKEAYMQVAATFDSLQKTIFLGSMLMMCVILMSAMIWAWTHRGRKKRNCVRNAYFHNFDKVAPGDAESGLVYKENLFSQIYALQKEVDATSFHHKMEVDKETISFERVIGQGAFGLVRRAVLRTDGRTVAVKTLRDLPTVDEMKSFYGEIEVMKSVGKHANIVGIVGHHTKNVRQMMLLTEYCDEGNLLTFLQKIYRHLGKEIEIDNSFGGCKLSSPSKSGFQCHTPGLAKLKSAECAFNFDTSYDEKDMCVSKMNICRTESDDKDERDDDEITLPGYSVLNESQSNNSSSMESNGEPSPPALSPRSLVVNKMYDVGRNDLSPTSNVCHSSCKCQVEIVTDNSGFVNDLHRRSTIRIRDCDCSTDQRYSNTEINNNIEPTAVGSRDREDEPEEQSKTIEENFQSLVANRSYMLEHVLKPMATLPPIDAIKPDHIEITSQDMLSFAEQISSGMDFLSLNKVVHRDLAARNVLVCSDKTVKISDFGLSRDVYQNNVYEKSGDGKLPIKWMAVESLLRRTYTSQSDVWSFGILLYEIVSLGRTPYPHIQQSEELIRFLQAEKRMEQPSTCSNELYELMRSCWETDPEQRPTFNVVNAKMHELIHLANKSGEEHILLDKHAAMKTGRAFNEPATVAHSQPTVVYVPTGEKEETDQAYLTPLSSP